MVVDLVGIMNLVCVVMMYGSVFFFKQKTAYEMRISDWSSDVCSSDLLDLLDGLEAHLVLVAGIAERGPRAKTCRKHRFGTRVHHVGRRVEVEALALMDGAVALHQVVDALGNVPRRQGCGPLREFLDVGFANFRHPGPAGQ